MTTPCDGLSGLSDVKNKKTHSRMTMLTVSRKLNQTVILGNEVSIKITALNPDNVSLTFVAPSDVMIDREENYLRKIQKMLLAQKLASSKD